MIRLQICVQHDPRRAGLLPPLLAELGPRAKVIVDPGADEPTRSPWRCYAACLRSLQPNATHLAVIQDDAQVCRDFVAALPILIAAHPATPICLFVPGVGNNARKILDACYRESRWAELDPNEFTPVVGMIWPRDHVASILEWTEQKKLPPSRRADDSVIGEWARTTRTRVLACVPSLIEHPDQVVSLVGTAHWGGASPTRVACCWLGEELSPLSLAW